MYFKSVCTQAENAPYTTEIPVSIRKIHPNSLAASGIRYMAIRKQPYPPNFISTPAWSIDTAVGAEAWPSGLHVWNGKRAPNTPNPRKVRGNQIHCCAKGILCSCAISRMFIVVPPAPKKIPKMPISKKAEPPINISVSFMAAYSLRPEPHTPISKYIGISAIS